MGVVTGHTGEVYSVDFSPDSQTVVSGSKDGSIKLWNLDGQVLKTLNEHTAEVKSVSFSPDGNLLASASVKGKVLLWDFDLANLMELGNNWVREYWETRTDKTL